MVGGLFDDLPPPSAAPPPSPAPAPAPVAPPLPPVDPPPSILKKDAPKKSALKRAAPDTQGGKQVRFRTNVVDTSKEKVIESVQKLSTHIGNPEKFPKVSKLVLQLLQAGGLSKDVADQFFSLLENSMSPPSKANAPRVRADYSALFSAVREKIDCFSTEQQSRILIWSLWAELANEFYTDDTFMFSKAAARLKQAIDDLAEESQLEDEKVTPEGRDNEVDPFGLNALLPSTKEGKIKQGDEAQALLNDRREALVECLRIAASRYKQKWAQTIIDIAAKHALDSRPKFDASQREAVEKIWSSVKEQQIKRKQGKTLVGKLDETPFERLRESYSMKKISIRKAVGSGGERSAEQWLG